MLKSILMLLIISNSCFAGSLYYGLHTDHTVPGTFNEYNRVVMAQLDSGFTVGSMVNSYNRASIMVGYVQPDKPIAFGLVLATGYEPVNFYLEDYVSSLPLMPLPVVSFSLDLTDSVSLTSNVVAGVVINSGLKFRF